ncbi:MAG: hypothetical protein Q4P34_05500 [Tissierellia bacterium]|nr:hypothetical protein [Tissierellia bacterium]
MGASLIDFNDIKINMNEILMILGYQSGDIDEYKDEIIECYRDIVNISNINYVYKILPLRGMKLGDTDIDIDTPDLANLLENCQSCIICAQTLGVSVDNELRKAGIIDLARAIMMDAAASSYIESVSSKIYDSLLEDYRDEGFYFTERFSPGYGLVPITLNIDFSKLLNAERRIGLKVAGSGLMIPRKSTIAIWGISNSSNLNKIDRCSDCKLRFGCKLKERGEFCGKK